MPGGDLDAIALFRQLPALRGRIPWIVLGRWPTPVEPLDAITRAAGGPPLWVKREDISADGYGGNKIRTLEALFGQARAAGAERVWATGAYGSNHALATAVHAPAAGLQAGAALFPQPYSEPAAANLRALLAARPRLVRMWSFLALPFAMARLRRGGEPCFVMEPGGATPTGALGHVSAALELAEQVEAGACPAPGRIVLALGSNCTTAGLMVGLQLAARLGVGFGPSRAPIPHVIAVRVTPWPVTSPIRIVRLARRTADLIAAHAGDHLRLDRRALRAGVSVDRRQLGRGYGRPTANGRAALALFAERGGPPLDLVYSGKSAAGMLALARAGESRPICYWATRSSLPLAEAGDDLVAATHPALARWLAR